MSDVYYYGNQPMLKYKSGKKFGAVPIDKVAADLIESLQAKVEKLEEANAHRKNLNAQMLMNAAESGNRNYLAEINQLQAKVEELSGLLKAAACPNCNGDGAYYDNMGDIRQCQWCYETKNALKQEGE